MEQFSEADEDPCKVSELVASQEFTPEPKDGEWRIKYSVEAGQYKSWGWVSVKPDVIVGSMCSLLEQELCDVEDPEISESADLARDVKLSCNGRCIGDHALTLREAGLQDDTTLDLVLDIEAIKKRRSTPIERYLSAESLPPHVGDAQRERYLSAELPPCVGDGQHCPTDGSSSQRSTVSVDSFKSIETCNLRAGEMFKSVEEDPYKLEKTTSVDSFKSVETCKSRAGDFFQSVDEDLYQLEHANLKDQ